MLFDERRTMKQNIFAKMRITPKRIVLSAVVAVFMLVLTFFAGGGHKAADHLFRINGAERHPAAAAQTVKLDNSSHAGSLSILCSYENLPEDGTACT